MSKCLRKVFMDFSTWYDSEKPKHKHDFSIECVLDERTPDINGNVNVLEHSYSIVMMCSDCHSFTKSNDYVTNHLFSYDKDRNLERKKLMEETMKKIPVIIAYRNNKKTVINYDRIIFPDGYEYLNDSF